LEANVNDIVTVLNDPEKAYPDNFDTPKRANALLFGLCQEAAEEIKKLRANIETLHAMYEVVTKQRDYLMDQQRAQVEAMRGRVQ
jgi:hypothetical protein